MRRCLISCMAFGALLSCSAQAAQFSVGVGLSLSDGPIAWDQARKLGFNAFRTDLPWAQMERSDNTYALPVKPDNIISFGKANNISTLVILGYGNPSKGIIKPMTQEQRAAYVKYCVAAVHQLSGVVDTFEVWNEWDSATGGGVAADPESYVELLKAVRPALLKENSNIKLLAGGISDHSFLGDWYVRFMKADGLKYVDGISFHPYVFQKRLNNGPMDAYNLVQKVIQMTDGQSAGRKIDMYISEIGWPTHDGPRGVSREELLANYISFMSAAASESRVKGIWWFGLRDQGDNHQAKNENFGLFDNGMHQKFDLSIIKKVNDSLRVGRPSVVCKNDKGLMLKMSPSLPTGAPWFVSINAGSLDSQCRPLGKEKSYGGSGVLGLGTDVTVWGQPDGQ